MKNLIITGMNEEDFIKYQKYGNAKCFICKREEDDESIIIEESEGSKFCSKKLEFFYYDVLFEDFYLKFPLCMDCYTLLSCFSNEANLSKTLANQIENRN